MALCFVIERTFAEINLNVSVRFARECAVDWHMVAYVRRAMAATTKRNTHKNRL